MLVAGLYAKVGEDQHENEDVVDAQGFFNDVTRQILLRRGPAVVDHAIHRVHRSPQPKPLAFIAVVDEQGKGQPQGDPHSGPDESLLHPDHMGLAVKDPEVQRKHQEHKADESGPQQYHWAPSGVMESRFLTDCRPPVGREVACRVQWRIMWPFARRPTLCEARRIRLARQATRR